MIKSLVMEHDGTGRSCYAQLLQREIHASCLDAADTNEPPRPLFTFTFTIGATARPRSECRLVLEVETPKQRMVFNLNNL